MLRFLQVLLLTTLLACSAFVAVKVPFLLGGPPRHLPTAETLYHLRGLVFGSHVITAQLPLVWLTAAWLGPRRGTVAVALYLGIGLGGLPIFTNGGGVAYLAQPTFGYLLAFLPAVLVAGRYAAETARFGRIWLGLLYALLIIQGVGFVYELFREEMLGSWEAWRQVGTNQILQYLPGHLALLTAIAAGLSGWRKLLASWGAASEGGEARPPATPEDAWQEG